LRSFLAPPSLLPLLSLLTACVPLPSTFQPKPLGEPVHDAPVAISVRAPVASVLLVGGGGACVPSLAKRPAATNEPFDPRCASVEDDPVSALVRSDLDLVEDGLVVWLGDNVHPLGLISEAEATRSKRTRLQREAGEAVLRRQIAAAGDPSRALFVAGDRDARFLADDPRGRERLAVQEGFVRLAGASMAARPSESVTVRDVGRRLRVVAFDSASFIAHAREARAELILTALDEAIAAAAADGRSVVLAAHHPVLSQGVHGRGQFWAGPILRYIPAARGEANHPDYEIYAARLLDRFDRWGRRESPTRDTLIAFVAAHDASLQVLEVGDVLHVVAGSADRGSRVWDELAGLDRVRYLDAQPGYVAVHETVDGSVRLEVIEAHKTRTAPSEATCRTVPGLPPDRMGCRVASVDMLSSPPSRAISGPTERRADDEVAVAPGEASDEVSEAP
jgi:hypothetical protein